MIKQFKLIIMEKYLFVICNSPYPYDPPISLAVKPSIGELIVPRPLDKHPLYLEVKQVVHKANELTLLIVEPFDWSTFHKSIK